MASGHALTLHRETGKKVRICDRNGKPRWSDLWLGLQWIVQPGEDAERSFDLRNGPGCRPYIRYPFTRRLGCTYSGWRARDNVGAIRFMPDEIAYAEAVRQRLGRFIVIEPQIAPKSNPNKQWGKWQGLVDLMRADGHLVVQLGPEGTETLPGAVLIPTRTFREGAAVLGRAWKTVLPEGGLHHAAGVMRRDAVVLFGGTVDAEATGYPWHTNIVDGPACGAWEPCAHCREIWDRLEPEAVYAALTRQS